MRMVSITYENLDLFVRFERDDEGPEGVYAFAGTFNGRDKYTDLDGVLTKGAIEQIHAKAESELRDLLQDEADEAADWREQCYDTPYA